MNNESEDSDLDRDVDASMRMFEKSKVGPAAAIMPVKPSRVLLVLDGSPQDTTATDSAKYLRERFNVETLVLDARDERPEDLAIAVAQEISGARPIARHDGESYDAILAAVADHAVDLVIIPCPFGRSFEHVGTDSAGTVIDVLLSRCDRPMVVIRRSDQSLQQCVAKVSMVVGSECDMESRAAAWAFGLAAAKATVSLNLVVEKEQYENIRSIIEALSPESDFDAEKFSEALTKTHQAIHGAMSKTATAQGMTYQLKPQTGGDAPPNLMSESSRMLLVMPLEVDDRFGQGFVQDRIRRSPHPVLVVPGHVQREA
ncbi:MAG: universal stress protein [Pirellulaceae bacterium]|nr:universal stress protein [Pirellulaceae bacterium]